MSKHHKDPRLEALKKGLTIIWTVPDGGDLASMREAYKHGQSLTFSPIVNIEDIQVGDIVYVKWHNGYLVHLVGEIQGDRFLIVNSLGKINGWVEASAILGRVTRITEPEPRSSVPIMLEQLEAAYQRLIERARPEEADAYRLLAVVLDLRWYADRLGSERWDTMPRSNKWSFEQNLWYFTRRARDAANACTEFSIWHFIDHGKVCVGLAAEVLSLFEYGEPY